MQTKAKIEYVFPHWPGPFAKWADPIGQWCRAAIARFTYLYFPLRTLSRSSRNVVPSNGSDPLTNVYRITPSDQTSTSGPSYFLPWNNSGAAYGGLPQNVSNLEPGVNSLEKPKSAILMFISLSNSRFSAFKSLWERNQMEYGCRLVCRRQRTKCDEYAIQYLWIIFFWWQYCTADTICRNLARASFSFILPCNTK